MNEWESISRNVGRVEWHENVLLHGITSRNRGFNCGQRLSNQCLGEIRLSPNPLYSKTNLVVSLP